MPERPFHIATKQFILAGCALYCLVLEASPAVKWGALGDTTLFGLVLCPGEASVVYEGNTFVLGDVAYFHFTSSTGADSVVKVTVFQSSVLDFWATTSPVCRGGTDGFIDFWDNIDITAPYVFSLDGGLTYDDEYNYTGLPAGFYELRAKNRFGCVFEYELTIPEYPPLLVDTRRDVVGCADSVQLDFSINGPPIPHTWQWQGDGVVSTDSIFFAKKPGTYLLTVANACDTVQHSIRVRMEEGAPEEVVFYVPNSFSPNGDGINDCFQGHIAPSVQLLDYQLLVFDRWGGQVFRANAPEGCWDGTRQGRELQPATFIWLIKARLPGCSGEGVDFLEKGEVILLR